MRPLIDLITQISHLNGYYVLVVAVIAAFMGNFWFFVWVQFDSSGPLCKKRFWCTSKCPMCKKIVWVGWWSKSFFGAEGPVLTHEVSTTFFTNLEVSKLGTVVRWYCALSTKLKSGPLISDAFNSTAILICIQQYYSYEFLYGPVHSTQLALWCSVLYFAQSVLRNAAECIAKYFEDCTAECK